MMATDFPTKDEDKKVSLRNSNYPQFDYDFIAGVKENDPDIYKAGGNIRGSESFNLWTKARNGEMTDGVISWIKEREAWAARHFAMVHNLSQAIKLVDHQILVVSLHK